MSTVDVLLLVSSSLQCLLKHLTTTRMFEPSSGDLEWSKTLLCGVYQTRSPSIVASVFVFTFAINWWCSLTSWLCLLTWIFTHGLTFGLVASLLVISFVCISLPSLIECYVYLWHCNGHHRPDCVAARQSLFRGWRRAVWSWGFGCCESKGEFIYLHM